MTKLFDLADDETQDRLTELIANIEGEFFGYSDDGWAETAKEIYKIAMFLERKAAKRDKKPQTQPMLFR